MAGYKLEGVPVPWHEIGEEGHRNMAMKRIYGPPNHRRRDCRVLLCDGCQVRADPDLIGVPSHLAAIDGEKALALQTSCHKQPLSTTRLIDCGEPVLAVD